MLSVGGRLVVVITSHEDRIVKSFFKELCGKGLVCRAKCLCKKSSSPKSY